MSCTKLDLLFISVIEAPDVDNLLEQFEAEEERGNCQDPKRKAQIVAAVNNHFSSSTRNFSPGSVPKIGKNLSGYLRNAVDAVIKFLQYPARESRTLYPEKS